jgi:hypothetical protein
MPFKCSKCKKEVMLLCYLSSYGQTRCKTKDDKDYCQECFDLKFKEKLNDKNK